jgi:hypothetical protein
MYQDLLIDDVIVTARPSSVVPEPGTMALCAAAIAAFAMRRRSASARRPGGPWTR